MKNISLIYCGGLALAVVLPLHAENWPQWRGPNYNGSSSEKNLPVTWGKATNIAWSAALPRHAGSTPIVWNDHIFLTSPDDQKNLLLLCFNRLDGSLRWKKTVGEGGDRDTGKNNMSSPSPVTDGKRVVALFGTGIMAGYDFEGRELWRRDLAREYGKFAFMWLYGSSPLLYDGRLYVELLQRDTAAGYPHAVDNHPKRESALFCMDPDTGKTLWRHERKTDAQKESMEAYTTPLPLNGNTGLELVVVGADYVTSHDARDGRELWRSAGLNPRNNTGQRDWFRVVASPVLAGDVIVACGPKNQPVIAIKTGGSGNVTASHRAWTYSDVTSDWSTPLYYKGNLYILDGAKRTLACVNPKTGKTQWSGSLGVQEHVWSSPTGADDKIYLLSERGTVVVVGTGARFEVLARNSVEDGTPSRSSVVAAQGQLFIRVSKMLYAIKGSRP